MTVETWLLYITAVLIMMSTPGPSQLLMLSNSMSNGFGRALFTAAGDLSANVLQMLAAGLGLAALIVASEHALTVIKFAGAAYLAWLGLRKLWKARRAGAAGGEAARSSLKMLWLQGFLTSATNPRAVVFFAALFPQFISPEAPFWPQFLILSATYIALDGTILSIYGALSSWLAAKLKGRARLWLDRVGGGFLLLAAVLLGLKTLDEQVVQRS